MCCSDQLNPPPKAVIRALAKVYHRGRGVIAKTRADYLALARNSISPSKSILRAGEHRLRITILIASAYVNAAVTARSLKYLTTLANGPLEEIRTPAPPRFVVWAAPLKSLRSVTVRRSQQQTLKTYSFSNRP